MVPVLFVTGGGRLKFADEETGIALVEGTAGKRAVDEGGTRLNALVD